MTKQAALAIANAALARDKYLTWGMDGYQNKHYLCRHCGEVFGAVDPETINHICPGVPGIQMEMFA